ncbi:hypothetical protein C8N42_103218 [Celeribacter persicus]|jgi:hypothetical protein|uniref:Uncharacterized protein n=1 Tax=Celeribacter persicus TaxID=1651082 RepID=A0A2T5HTM0_9RHOB|nr:hypothetical protein C8N42_103218 [Celeribacter persicus]
MGTEFQHMLLSTMIAAGLENFAGLETRYENQVKSLRAN